MLSNLNIASIKAAICEEITASQEMVKTEWLEIDGIEYLTDVPGNFVYRLVLSSPVNFYCKRSIV